MPENPTHILDYAPRPRLWRRRSFRLTVIAVLLPSLVAAGVYWYPDISFRIRLVYWQRQCMNHVIPPDKVILTADPRLVPILLQDPDYVQTTAPFVPGPLAAYRPRCYREYQPLTFLGITRGEVIVFMHRLRSQRGIERLVFAFDRSDAFRPEGCIEVVIVHPNPVFDARNAVHRSCTFQGPRVLTGSSGGYPDAPTIHFHPGQFDPTDPSHFTVRWEITHDPTPTHGIFDFRLSPDGTTVTRTDTTTSPTPK